MLTSFRKQAFKDKQTKIFNNYKTKIKMKIKLLLAILISILFLTSCEKEAITVQDARMNGLVHYNDENSTPVPWNELPAAFQNAPILDNREQSIDDLEQAVDHSRSNCKSFLGFIQARGGNSGSDFLFLPQSNCDRIYGMVIKAGAWVDGLLIYYKREDGSIYAAGYAGGNGGNFHGYLFEEDEFIWALNLRTSNVVNRITIYTDNKSFAHGGYGGSYRAYFTDPGEQVLGFYGKSGTYLNKLGGVLYSQD